MCGQREIAVIGCAELVPQLEGEGWIVSEVEYFWGNDDRASTWCAAVVDTRVGGGTGRLVAERLRRRLVEPLVLFGRSETEQVLRQFAGVVRSSAGTEEFFRLLEECAERTARIREASPTTIDVSDSMIVSAQDMAGRVNARRAPTVRTRPSKRSERTA